MNRASLRASLSALVAHVPPKNARQIHCDFFDDMPHYNALGIQSDDKPAEGWVVAHTDEAFIVKTHRTRFVAVDRRLATLSPALDDKVRITPYARRNFAGDRLDATEQGGHTRSVARTYPATHITARIPLTVIPSCPYLVDLVEQLEIMPTPEGWRTIANMLTDARAKDIEIVDPDEKELLETRPEISFAVDTRKFSGRIAVLYEPVLGPYAVELRAGGAVRTRVDNVEVTRLAKVMTDLIDDGDCPRIRVEILWSGRSSKRGAAK